jgi:ATP/maltotriose-dependent transcriptional regulator MalT
MRRRIHRERLVERIRRSADRRVALVVAGAGFGKSTAVLQSLTGNSGDAFYRVVPDTTTLLAFLRGLTDALDKANVPGAHLSLAIAYERAMQSSSPAAELARWLAEHLREAALRIVIDDLHHAAASEVPAFIRATIDAAPESVRWLLVARDASALPVASWLAHGACDVPIDESVLRFTPDEMAALATAAVPDLPPARLEEIARLTGGWPSAVDLTLQLAGGDLPPAGASPFETYRELARRVLDAVPEPEQTVLLESAVVAAASDAYDSLFREFLLGRLRERGADVERAALLAAAVAAEERGDARSALTFYQRAEMPDALNRILAAHGVALMDGGFADVVEAALATLDRAEFDGGAAIMLLKAIRDAQLVRLDSAEAWFQLAIAATDDDDLRTRIVHRYALELMRRGRIDAIDVLESALQSASPEHDFQPLLCATLATAYAVVDRLDDARASVTSAMSRLRPDLPAALRTRAYHQAAYVALRRADIPEARRYAELVLEVAVPNGFYDLAARAHSILYEIEHSWEASPRRALAHIESVAAYGQKSGDSHIRQWALLSAYYIEAERGNAAMMGTIERALNAPEVLQTTEASNAALLPGQALRASWSGDFGHAYRLLANSAEGQVSAGGRAGRWAEIALFAAAAGLADEAREAVTAARNELTAVQTGKHGTQTLAYLLIALSVLDDPMTWLTVHDAAVAGGTALSDSPFLNVAEALHNHWFAQRDHDAVLSALNALRDADFGGIAAMIEALPASSKIALHTFP